MTDIAQPLPGEQALEQRAAVGVLGDRIGLTWESVAWASISVAGFVARFWDLGARAFHQDESLRAYYSYQILQGSGYERDPALHGPFQFFGTALTFFVTGGASDYTARVLPALFGAVLVFLPLAFRNHLGRTGALMTATLIALSPTLLHYSRFAREDIYFAVFTLGIVVCLWRYVDEQRPGYLYGAATLLALSFATKETAFIFVAVVLLFLNLWVALELATPADHTRTRTGLSFVLYAPFAWAITAVWPMLGRARKRFGLGERSPAMDTLLVLGTLALPQFAAAIKLPVEAAGIDITSDSQERMLAIPAVVVLIGASTMVGLAWNRRVWPVAAACFYVPYTLLFTGFFTDIEGFGSGIWESLDYWIAQHGAEGTKQPEFYYLMFWPGYEYLALAIAGPALLFFTLRGGPRSWLLSAVTVVALLFFFGADTFENSRLVEIVQIAMLPVAAVALFLAARGSMFERFLVFCTAASLVAYSTVGARMPWLSVHTALPLLLLAGYSAGRLVSNLNELRATSAISRRRLGIALGVAGALSALVLGVLSARTAVLASYDHGDVPREFLFFNQTSPDVPDIVERLDELALTSGRGNSLRIQVDQEHPWPWAWYLRGYDVSFHSMGPEFVPDEGAILIMSAANEVHTAAYNQRYHPAQRYTLRWSFPEDYRGIGNKDNLAQGIGDFAAALRERRTWDRWWGFWFHRDILPMGGTEGRLLVPFEFEAIDFVPVGGGAAGGEPGAGPGADIEGRLIIGRLGTGPGEMQNPVGLALDANGSIYVVDNHLAQVLKFDDRGSVGGELGGPGGEPGQLNQPSDIAVDAAGTVYVADTWNHRIQKFGPDMAPAGGWGQPTRDLINPGAQDLWTPRAVAVASDGTIYVVDTGTNKVRRYAADGTHIADAGRRGREPGEFEGPTGIAIAPDGSIFVADAGNARIQVFGAGFTFRAAWPLEEWADRLSANQPQIEALPDGRLIATDPAHSRILLINTSGQVTATLDTVLGVPLFSPSGVAFDPETRFVYVTDGRAGHIRRFPFTDFALR